mmetsp:Transcript_16836/g.52285  ORF Transcript_16836/g.52285 Transcript_16836/m.52285 type:complete len:279 (-) Transcript_16836:71-907(-)
MDADGCQRLGHGLALLVAHEPVVDVHANHAIGADGLVQQRSAHRRIHPTTCKAEHANIATHLVQSLSDLRDRMLLAVGHCVGEAASSRLQEVAEHAGTIDGEIHFRMELNADVMGHVAANNSCDDSRAAACHDRKVLARVRDAVSVGEEHLLFRIKPPEEDARGGVTRNDVLTVLAGFGGRDCSSKSLAQELHPVANAKHRCVRKLLEKILVESWCVRGVHARRTPTDHHSLHGRIVGNGFGPRVQRHQPRFHFKLAQAAIDHLSKLRSCIEHNHALR